ncbi:thiolase family protein [Rhodobacteraceae bacterium RKSG542]|uniref:thiolase family protein n=1 Tax=Pseudovibrio flavus TaxID=2529854 RepID=UPI0012BB4B12|nr:thiolase family protein [Pseudovibrio flavus]MTI16780.1 thiolase family protein [Pseudovibrio flavus]
MGEAVIVAARRSSVQPKGGLFKALNVGDLWAPVAQAAMASAGISPDLIDQVVLGNGLYGSGNPARVCALQAGISQQVPAVTLDSQCCSGLDAVLFAASLIESGRARIVICGGVESFSRRPLRAHQPLEEDRAPEFYLRPPFTPWIDRDPDMLEAAARLAALRGITAEEQARWAVESHRKAKAAQSAEVFGDEITSVTGEGADLLDGFTRSLSEKLALRAPVLARHGDGEITSATTAVEADAAAALVVMDRDLAKERGLSDQIIIGDGLSIGGDPELPPAAPEAAIKTLLERNALVPDDLHVVELMEAFAVQALCNASVCTLPLERVNIKGGALARGHPIGASGAILAVRLFQELKNAPSGAKGMAAIAAAGGLATALILSRG